MTKKSDCDYEGKATLITARAKGNATLIAALSGLLLAGGNFVNDFFDRHHQRQLNESTYSAAIAEIRSLKAMVARYHPPAAADAVGERDPVLIIPTEMMAEMTVESNAAGDESFPEPEPDRGLVQAPSFDKIKEYIQQSGKALRFEVAQPAD